MPESFSQLKAKDLLSSSFVRIDRDAPISKLLAALKKAGEAHALVFADDAVVGIVSGSALLKNVDVSKTKVSAVMRTLPTVSMNDSLEKMIRIMRDADLRVLPVMERDEVAGVVSAHSIMERLRAHPFLEKSTARDLSTANPFVLSSKDDVGMAVKMMKDNRIKRIPVVDEKKRIVGIVRLEDLATGVLLSLDRQGKEGMTSGKGSQSIPKHPALSLSVKSVMSDNFSIISPTEKGKNVLRMLSLENNPTVIVSENGHNSLVSTQSVFDVFLKSKSQETAPVSRVQITHAPGLDEIDRANVEQMLQRTYDKVIRVTKTTPEMRVVYKQIGKTGLRAKTEVHITVQGVGKTLHAEEWDWRVLRATKKACDSLESEVSRLFKQRNKRS